MTDDELIAALKGVCRDILSGELGAAEDGYSLEFSYPFPEILDFANLRGFRQELDRRLAEDENLERLSLLPARMGLDHALLPRDRVSKTWIQYANAEARAFAIQTVEFLDEMRSYPPHLHPFYKATLLREYYEKRLTGPAPQKAPAARAGFGPRKFSL